MSVILNEGLRELNDRAFGGSGLRRIALQGTANSSLEKIGNQCFEQTRITEITVPRGVIEIWDGAFLSCKRLKTVTFQSGSRLERIGKSCFKKAGIEQITLSAALRKVDDGAFEQCGSIWAVYVEDGCDVCLYNAGIPVNTYVGPPDGQLVGKTHIRDLVSVSEIVLPECLELVGNY